MCTHVPGFQAFSAFMLAKLATSSILGIRILITKQYETDCEFYFLFFIFSLKLNQICWHGQQPVRLMYPDFEKTLFAMEIFAFPVWRSSHPKICRAMN